MKEEEKDLVNGNFRHIGESFIATRKIIVFILIWLLLLTVLVIFK